MFSSATPFIAQYCATFCCVYCAALAAAAAAACSPGVALGAFLGRTGIVTDGMMMAAAETLPDLISDVDAQLGLVYPRLKVCTNQAATKCSLGRHHSGACSEYCQ